MKRKQIMIWFLVAVVAVSITACQKKKKDDTKAQPLVIETEEDNDTDQNGTDIPEVEQNDGAGATASDSVAKDTEKGVKKLYFSNNNYDGYDSEEITGDVSPESLLKLLSDKQIISTNVKSISCEKKQMDGIDVVDLDLSSDILTDLQSQGSTGETMTMGSICNTFLSAYGCQKIKVTAEGQPVVTEHGEYTDYMDAF